MLSQFKCADKINVRLSMLLTLNILKFNLKFNLKLYIQNLIISLNRLIIEKSKNCAS